METRGKYCEAESCQGCGRPRMTAAQRRQAAHARATVRRAMARRYPDVAAADQAVVDEEDDS